MASTWSSLYSDFRSAVKIYTEKLDVTAVEFMRKISRAMQQFQRDTKMVESYAILTYDSTNEYFMLPTDVMMIILVKDSNDYTIIQQDFTQFRRNIEQLETGRQTVPAKYSYKISREPNADTNLYRIRNNNYYPLEQARMYSVYAGTLLLYPYLNDTTLKLWYYPDMPAFDRTAALWEDWFP